MNQNTNTSATADDLKWGLTTPVKFMDKDCGEVELLGFGVFTYQVTNQEVFNASAAKSNMDAETYARGILLSIIIEEINKFSGKLALSLNSLVKGENILNVANSKIASLGFMYTKVVVENINLTDESAKKMQEMETNKIKAAITGREIAGAKVEETVTTPTATTTENSDGPQTEQLPEKNPSVLGLIIMAIVVAIVMTFLFK